MGGGLSVLTSLSCEDLPVTDPDSCKHKFCEKWGPGHFHCADCHARITDETLMAEEDRIIDGIVDDSVPEDGVYRGVTIQFLVDFANSCKCWDMTTRDVRRRFVMPATRATRCRFVELPEMEGCVGRAVTFVSHTWGAKFGDLVAALCDGNADRKRMVWVDIFAVRQWPSHKPDLDFSAVVRQCTSFVIVCTSLKEIANVEVEEAVTQKVNLEPHVRAQVAFLRVWCLVELHEAIASKIAIILKCGAFKMSDEKIKFDSNQEMMSIMPLLIDIESADATVALDKDRILGNIRAAEGGAQKVNEIIRGVISGSRFAADYPVVQCAASGDDNALSVLLSSPSEYVVPVAACGYTQLLRQLLDIGADVKAQSEGKTALNLASLGGHLECVKLLLERGSDVNEQDSNRATSLMGAAAAGHAACVKHLLECGAKTDILDDSNCSAFVYAVGTGRKACVELLLKSEMDVNMKYTSAGLTALHLAMFTGKSELIDLLVAGGCDPSLLDASGRTALQLAEESNNTACVEVLMKYQKE